MMLTSSDEGKGLMLSIKKSIMFALLCGFIDILGDLLIIPPVIVTFSF
jgi:hypothetical protein